MKNRYAKDKAVILTCGPSLADYDDEQIYELCKGKPVLLVKQAFERFGHLLDMEHCYHFFNRSHAPLKGAYDYSKYKPCLTFFSDQNPVWKGNYDIACKIAHYHGPGGTACGKKVNLNDWTFAETGNNRPCGPGILYETVFFIVEHFGFSEVDVIGWDLYSKSARTHEHFYDIKKNTDKISRDLFVPEHQSISVEGSKKFYEWFLTKDCQLNIIGDKSYAWKDIPRKDL